MTDDAVDTSGSTQDRLVFPDSYKDSVRLLEATRTMLDVENVIWATAVMATPANVAALADEGFESIAAGANDLVLAARGDGPAVAEALELGKDSLFTAVADTGSDGDSAGPVTDVRQAVAAAPGANLAIVSVPGPYAALEAHKAMTAGLDVLLFSDNVPLDAEIELKRRARSLGRLVMGPGAGTAMLGGVGLAFANRVGRGPVGIVAAAGTGAQEVMSLLDRWGVGVSHVIGLGGRDLSEAVGGLMATSAIEALEADDGTEAILVVSKPPTPAVAEALLGPSRSKPIVASMIGLRDPVVVDDGVVVCNTLEQGVVETMHRLGSSPPDTIGDLDNRLATVVAALPPTRRRLVGLFSGGTLCYEAMTIASRHIGPIHSNTPLDAGWGLPEPDGAHVCLDLGEEEYTEGRPHPMIDPEARISFLRAQVTDPTVAVVVVDVVIGDGAHPDPAGLLAPVAADIVESGAAVVAYVLGTERDPQGFERQRRVLTEAGCLVTETAARAALAAAAVITRDPALVHEDLAVDLAASTR